DAHRLDPGRDRGRAAQAPCRARRGCRGRGGRMGRFEPAMDVVEPAGRRGLGSRPDRGCGAARLRTLAARMAGEFQAVFRGGRSAM
ncbi:MAG: FIG00802228: hypothetical protein, partial [uncultured Microvirga sp.]